MNLFMMFIHIWLLHYCGLGREGKGKSDFKDSHRFAALGQPHWLMRESLLLHSVCLRLPQLKPTLLSRTHNLEGSRFDLSISENLSYWLLERCFTAVWLWRMEVVIHIPPRIFFRYRSYPPDMPQIKLDN